ncbi:MAG: N-acetyltransferase family protein [Spirochaetes bacterium]|jgi:phosphinothricin acetyltransferase|nr:N-acetyltransferase family protein [Spirochaetota bacterium]
MINNIDMASERKHILKDKTEIRTRNAVKEDLASINDIYNYYVDNSTCTWQTNPEKMEERQAWFDEHTEEYPVIVAESNGKIVGWASISKFKGRDAYKPTVENSIYIRHDSLFRGTGAVLLKELIELAKGAGYHSMIAGISADQKASIVLHEKHGFTKAAHLKEAGYKFNKWLDVVYYQLLL